MIHQNDQDKVADVGYRDTGRVNSSLPWILLNRHFRLTSPKYGRATLKSKPKPPPI